MIRRSECGGVECGEALEVMGRLGADSIGAVITDPPFFVGIGRPADWTETRELGDDPWTDISSIDAGAAWAKPFMQQFHRLLRRGGTAAIMAGVHGAASWAAAAEEAGMRWMAELMVLWNAGKPRARNFGSLHTHILWFIRPGARHTWNTERRSIYSNILVCKKVSQSEKEHPAQKPIELTTFLISLLTKPTDVILDPFCGAGSTLVSAVHCSRSFIGVDRDPECCKIARRRVRHADIQQEGEIYLWVNSRMEEL